MTPEQFTEIKARNTWCSQHDPGNWMPVHQDRAALIAELEPLQEVVAHLEDEKRVLEQDAVRFRWLTEDHPQRETRARRDEILKYLPVMSYSAASRDIDVAMQECLAAEALKESSNG